MGWHNQIFYLLIFGKLVVTYTRWKCKVRNFLFFYLRVAKLIIIQSKLRISIRDRTYHKILWNRRISLCDWWTPYKITSPTVYGLLKSRRGVLSTNLCSSSTGEFCSEKKGGLNVGNLKVGSVLFVDDTTVIDGDVVNARNEQWTNS